MKNIKCVSFPRSGHHLLVKCLLKYFANNPNHLEDIFSQDSNIYDKVLNGGEMYYCENYIHCNNYPTCTDEKTNFQKTHDNDGDFSVIIDPTHNYIVQYRNPIESIVSLYKWGKYNIDKEHWENFALEQITYWKIFVKKWVLSNIDNRLLVNYHSLINTPFIELSKIIQFMGETININLLNKVINCVNVEPQNNIKDFIYYNKKFFDKLKKMEENNL